MLMRTVEFMAMLTTLAGYYMVTHGMVELGATVALFSNIMWVYFAHEMEKGGFGLLFLNSIFILINLGMLGVL